ncbi:hypothetical protein EAF00_007934 [Botryotinia globosa]|nr:hypothetical protein EAF00_007934 [Botryotinia globosa]
MFAYISFYILKSMNYNNCSSVAPQTQQNSSCIPTFHSHVKCWTPAFADFAFKESSKLGQDDHLSFADGKLTVSASSYPCYRARVNERLSMPIEKQLRRSQQHKSCDDPGNHSSNCCPPEKAIETPFLSSSPSILSSICFATGLTPVPTYVGMRHWKWKIKLQLCKRSRGENRI